MIKLLDLGDGDGSVNTLDSVEGTNEGTNGIISVRSGTTSKIQEVRGIWEPAPMSVDLVVAPGITHSLETNVRGVRNSEGSSGDGHGGFDGSVGWYLKVLINGPLIVVGLGLSVGGGD